jgi:hypothetical protein
MVNSVNKNGLSPADGYKIIHRPDTDFKKTGTYPLFNGHYWIEIFKSLMSLP